MFVMLMLPCLGAITFLSLHLQHREKTDMVATADHLGSLDRNSHLYIVSTL